MLNRQKTVPSRNPHLLAMARGRPCLLRLAGCDGGGETTVAAHSNSMAHGKAKARKADDHFTVWACYGCHTQLDQGQMGRQAKDEAFAFAHIRQRQEWRRIADDELAKQRDSDAAKWALERLL